MRVLLCFLSGQDYTFEITKTNYHDIALYPTRNYRIWTWRNLRKAEKDI
jgi:hypothetical protein